jgi:hypothetical protein
MPAQQWDWNMLPTLLLVLAVIYLALRERSKRRPGPPRQAAPEQDGPRSSWLGRLIDSRTPGPPPPRPEPRPGQDSPTPGEFFGRLLGPPRSWDGYASVSVRGRQVFFTTSEAEFHTRLTRVLASREVSAFPKVRLLDVLNINRGNYWVDFRKISPMHVDWLVVTLPHFKPTLVIELDGASHDLADQQRKDATKDEALRQANLPILRLNARDMPDEAALEQLLAPHLPTPPVPREPEAVTA